MRIQKSKIRIARIIARLNIGGPAIHTIVLTEGLDNDRFATYLVAGKPAASEGEMMDLVRSKNLDLEYIPELGRDIGFNDIIAIFKLFRFIKKVKPHIVHTHTAKAGALGRIAAILAGAPIKIHTFHGHVLDGYFSPFKATLFRVIERILAYFTDTVIVVSEAVREDIVCKFRIVPKDKCAVIRLGFDLERFLKNEHLKGNFRRKINVSHGLLLVGIVGRLVPIKNHRMFLDVAKDILTNHPIINSRFIIVGDGEAKEGLMAYVDKLKIGKFVIFTGWVDDLAALYADLDVVTLTSLNEGTPVSLIEAMASSRPVISTDVGGVRDVIIDGENGLLVKKGDVKDFSEKLLSLLSDIDKRQRFGICGRELAQKKYFKDRLINEMQNLYLDSLVRKGLA